MTRYVVIGAGAIGGVMGGRLARAGRDVVLVARGDNLDALRSRGLRLRTPTEDLTVPVHAVVGPDDLRLSIEDILVLATKTQQAQAALLPWVDTPVRQDGRVVGTVGEHLPVLTALNGVASERIALRYFRRVYGVCVWMPAVHLAPGEVIARGTPVSGILHVGRVPARDDDAGRRLLQKVEQDGAAARLTIALPDDVMPWKYRKLISNIGNAFDALVSRNGDIGPLVAAAEAEARRILDAAGIAYTDDAQERAARTGLRATSVPGEPAELGGSTWQSLARGTGNIETDYLNGEIALIAHQHGLDAPINARIASIARAAARRGDKPGATSADDLSRLLGLDV